jgi:hypothetical protein
MLTGWYPQFSKNRPLTSQEEKDHLPFGCKQDVIPEDGVGLIHFNSTCMEFVDRGFKLKGMSATLAFLFCELIVLGAFFGGIFLARESTQEFSITTYFILAAGEGTFLFLAYFVWRNLLRFDLFAYTHNPIRFNRKTGKIHVFRHNGPGGVLSVPWGDSGLYFHIGHGMQNKVLRDLRCHLLDASQSVQDTFTVGHSTDEDLRIVEQWEFIRRYMEQGPAHVVDDPLDGMITLSLKPSWKNCYMWVCFALGQSLFPMRHVLFPLYGALTLTRWLSFKTCKEPVWPTDIQTEGAMEPGDPHHWPEPEFMGAFAEDDAIYQRAVRRNELRKQRL